MNASSVVHYVKHFGKIVNFDGEPHFYWFAIGSINHKFGPYVRYSAVEEFRCWTDACRWMGVTDHGVIADAWEELCS